MATSFADLKSSLSGGGTTTKKGSSKISSFSDLKSSIGEKGLSEIQKKLEARNLEEKRKSDLLSFQSSQEQGIKASQEFIKANEQSGSNVLPLGLFGDAIQSAKDIFTRKSKDEEYLRQIQENNKLQTQILEQKRNNPDKSQKYDIMLDALKAKNDLLVGASGGEIKGKSNLQLAGQSIGTAVDVMPFGSGITQAGRMVVKQGGAKLAGSLLKEGLTFGLIGGGGKVLEEQKTAPKDIFSTLASEAFIGTLANLGIGLGFNKIGEKFSKWVNGEQVSFTPKEKDFLDEQVPDFSNDTIFNGSGIDSPTKKTEDDMLAKTIASTEDDNTIRSLIADKVPEKEIPALAKTLKLVNDPDEVANILDSFNPDTIKKNLAEQISVTDSEKRIATLIKESVNKEDIPTVSKILKNMESEEQIIKVLDNYKKTDVIPDVQVNEVTPPEVTIPQEKVFKERDMTDAELADALMKKERSMFNSDNPRFQANSKAAGMKYSSIKKRLAGDVTQKEFNNARKYLESGYIGKEVKVGKEKGIIKKMIYGDYGIDFGDGKIKRVSLDKIRGKKVSDKQVIQHIIDGAKKELEGRANIFKSVSRKISEEVLPEPKVETPKPKTIEKPAEKVKEPVKEVKNEVSKTNVEEPKVEEKKVYTGKTPSGLSETTIRDATKESVFKELENLDVPELDTMSMTEEIDKAVKFLVDDERRAIQVALGNENAPSGIKVGSIYSAVKEMAIANGDVDLIRQLALSENINAIARQFGQEVKAFDSGIAKDPVKIIKEIMDIRKEAAPDGVSKTVSKDVKDIQSKVLNETKNTDADVSSLIKGIKCIKR